MTDPHPGAGGVAGEHFGLEQRLEEALVRPLLLACERSRLLEPLQHRGAFSLESRYASRSPAFVFAGLTRTARRSRRARAASPSAGAARPAATRAAARAA